MSLQSKVRLNGVFFEFSCKFLCLWHGFYWWVRTVGGRQGAQAGAGGCSLGKVVLVGTTLVLLHFGGRSWR